jgi:hypothetical protein
VWPAADIGGSIADVNAQLCDAATGTVRRIDAFNRRQEMAGIPMVSATHSAHPGTRRVQTGRRASLNLPLDKVSFIILKAREYDAKEGESDPDEGSNAIDDGQTDVLTDNGEDPVREELLGAIRSLNEDERMRLVALAWVGRGTYSKEVWREAIETARSEHSRRTAEYLLSMPLLGDYLEDGLAAFDEGIVDDSDTREGVNQEDEPLGNMPDKPARQ